MSGHPEYYLDGTGPSIAVSGPHEEFFNSAFGICLGRKRFSDGCCRQIRMHKVWKDIGLRHHRVEQMSIMIHEEDLIQEIAVPGKHGMEDLMQVLKESEKNSEAIPVNMHQGNTAAKRMWMRQTSDLPLFQDHW